MDSKALMTMSEAKMLQRVEMAKFPQQLTIQDKKILVAAALTYGLDPLMGELTIYQGRPFIGIDGRYRKAQETGHLDGVESRPATKAEKAEREIPDGDYLYRAEVWCKGATHAFVGWGRVRAAETKPGSNKPGDNTSTYKPIQNDPQRMAEKRAEAQALRKAFHIPLPSAEDIGSPEEEPASIRVVNITTGEIKETAAVDGTPLTADQEFEKLESANPKSSAMTSAEETIKQADQVLAKANKEPASTDPTANLGTLLTWVASHGKTYTREWLFKSQSQTQEELMSATPGGQTARAKAVAELKELCGWE